MPRPPAFFFAAEPMLNAMKMLVNKITYILDVRLPQAINLIE
jgi:hypothetical protein